MVISCRDLLPLRSLRAASKQLPFTSSLGPVAVDRDIAGKPHVRNAERLGAAHGNLLGQLVELAAALLGHGFRLVGHDALVRGRFLLVAPQIKGWLR